MFGLWFAVHASVQGWSWSQPYLEAGPTQPDNSWLGAQVPAEDLLAALRRQVIAAVNQVPPCSSASSSGTRAGLGDMMETGQLRVFDRVLLCLAKGWLAGACQRTTHVRCSHAVGRPCL